MKEEEKKNLNKIIIMTLLSIYKNVLYKRYKLNMKFAAKE